MTKEIKYLHDFEAKFDHRTCYGDWWRGQCWYKGQIASIERMFYGYPKSEIKRILRQELVSQLNKGYLYTT